MPVLSPDQIKFDEQPAGQKTMNNLSQVQSGIIPASQIKFDDEAAPRSGIVPANEIRFDDEQPKTALSSFPGTPGGVRGNAPTTEQPAFQPTNDLVSRGTEMPGFTDPQAKEFARAVLTEAVPAMATGLPAFVVGTPAKVGNALLKYAQGIDKPVSTAIKQTDEFLSPYVYEPKTEEGQIATKGLTYGMVAAGAPYLLPLLVAGEVLDSELANKHLSQEQIAHLKLINDSLMLAAPVAKQALTPKAQAIEAINQLHDKLGIGKEATPEALRASSTAPKPELDLTGLEPSAKAVETGQRIGAMDATREAERQAKIDQLKTATTEPEKGANPAAEYLDSLPTEQRTEILTAAEEAKVPASTILEQRKLGLFSPQRIAKYISDIRNTDTAQKLHDYVTIDPLPKMSRIGKNKELVNAGVEHAAARIAAPHIVDDLLAKVFPDAYKNPEGMSRTIDILNKDNVLAGYDAFHYRAAEARKLGNEKEARAWEEMAYAIESKHNLNAYNKQIQAALNDPKVFANINRWKQYVEPLLNDLYKQVKRIDPNAELESRGKYTDTRINLVTKEKAEQWAERFKDEQKPLPEPVTSNYRNPNVKHDAFDVHAKFTGDYSTDARTALLTVLGPRYNEATKLAFYDALTKSGAAIEAKPGQLPPDMIQGQEVTRLPIKVPETNREGQTRQVERALYVRQDIAKEIRQVLNTDTPLQQNPVAKFLTTIQLAQIADAVTHTKNILSVVTSAQGAGSAWKDVTRKMPMLGTADAIVRISRITREIMADTPAIREEISDMAKQGLVRSEFPPTGIQKVTHAQQFLFKADTAARLIMNRFFDNLVERNLAKDTIANRRDFVNQIGQYNARLMGELMQKARQSGLSPFIVAGRNYNRMGRRIMTGEPGVEAVGPAAERQMRLTNLAGVATLTVLPIMLNVLTTGNPAGRSGTPLGAWDLGGAEDEKGKHRVIDLFQIVGIRRGLRSTGLDASIEGWMSGQNANQILGKAIEQAGQSAIHPWLGPAAGFVSKAATGRQLDMRGQMEAQNIPEKGGMQYLENTRAALESQNPLVYSAIQPIFESMGLVDKPRKPYAEDVAATFLKSPFGAFGVRNMSPGKTAAEELISTTRRTHFSDSRTPDDLKRMNSITELRSRYMSGDISSISELRAEAQDSGVTLTPKIIRMITSDSSTENNIERFKEGFKGLSAKEAVSVWEVANEDERVILKPLALSKISNAKNLTPIQKRELREKILE
jgi:hypothetical protein